MKLKVCFILFFCLPVISKGQYNHVPNGSFEYYTICDNAHGTLKRLIGWKAYNNGSPDYYQGCANRTPSNILGYQHAADGQSYIGGLLYNAIQGNIKEYFEAEIIPLQPYITYEASMSVSLADTSYYGTNDLGMFFYEAGPDTFTTTYYPNIIAQVMYSGYGTITDTQNWTRLIDTFVADSAYSHIVIGGFLHDSLINVDTVGTSGISLGFRNAYYYFDSIVVKALDSFSVIFDDTLLCAGDTIEIKYITPDQYGVNNVFTAQLSNGSGSFANPVNIGSKTTQWGGFMTCVIPPNTANGSGYRIRVVSSSGAGTSRDNLVNIRIGNVATSGSSAGTNSPVCAGSTLTLNASSAVSGTTFLWTGPNSFSSTNANNSITNASSSHTGTYYLTMQIHGCTRKDTLQAQVKPTPAKPVAGSNAPLCASASLQLTAGSSTSGVSWGWTGPGSYTSSAQNPVRANATTAMSGNYVVTADLNGCTAKDTVTVVVNPQPNAVTLSGNNPVCSGDTVYLNSTQSTTGASYSWVGPNSFSANTQNSIIANSTTTATGWYVLTVGLSGCSYKDSIYTTVNQTPAQPNISYISPLCVGETLNLSTTATGSYYWKGVGNFTSNQQNPNRSNMQFGDTGSYSLAVVVSGCTSDTAYTNVTINPLPFVAIAASPGAAICSGQQVQFTAYPNLHGGTPGYAWYVNGVAVGNSSTVFTTTTLNNGDIVRCDMTEITKCSSPITDPSNDITMTVNPWLAPKASISANPGPSIHPFQDITFTAVATDAGANPTYQWKRNGINEAGATGPAWGANAQALSNGDDICVLVRSSYSCPQPDTVLSNCIELEVRLGIGEVAGNSGIKIYPNPVRDILHIEAPLYLSPKGRGLNIAGVTVELIDVLGRCAKRQLLIAHGTSPFAPIKGGIVDVSSLVAGVYVVRVNGVVAGRVVKE